jgi:hypothetical protein
MPRTPVKFQSSSNNSARLECVCVMRRSETESHSRICGRSEGGRGEFAEPGNPPARAARRGVAAAKYLAVGSRRRRPSARSERSRVVGVASPDGTRFYTRGQDHVRAWDAATAGPGISFGAPTGMWKDWQRGGPIWTLAVSPDGKRVVSTNDTGVITIHNADDGATLVTLSTPPEMRTVSVIVNGQMEQRELPNVAAQTCWCASFFPDGRSSRRGIEVGRCGFGMRRAASCSSPLRP